MDDEQLRSIIARLLALRAEALAIEDILKSQSIEAQNLLDQEQIDLAFYALSQLLRERIFLALERINLRDDYYTFIRAIDGDTIVVAPPDPLRDWMKDIHVRLYGLETPELSEELGHQYRQHLEELCSIDARGHLRIVWERERIGTNYEGFPLTSFERGIGHVFFQIPDSRYVYINGLMHLLKHSSLRRRGKNLLRGRRIVESFHLDSTWQGPCPIELKSSAKEPSPTFQQIASIRPPICLLNYSYLPNLNPLRETFSSDIVQALQNGWRQGFGCLIEQSLVRDNERFLPYVLELSASPFDLALTYLNQWATTQS